MNYLKDIPQEVDQYGFSKVLLVRNEVINFKHILTEIFVRKTVNIDKYLNEIEYTINDYIEFMTNRLRKIHNFDRQYNDVIDDIIRLDRSKFFPIVELYKPLKNTIVLDFDGVVTKNSFENLYNLCIDREKTIICSANPTIKPEYFDRRNLPQPKEIHSCKGKIAKMKRLIEIIKSHDNVFYVDDEDKYLEFAWLFGIKTYKYINNKIIGFSLNSK